MKIRSAVLGLQRDNTERRTDENNEANRLVCAMFGVKRNVTPLHVVKAYKGL